MPQLAQEQINLAARELEAGRLVAFPTETVYGLGADAENPDAVARIYAAKGRPANSASSSVARRETGSASPSSAPNFSAW